MTQTGTGTARAMKVFRRRAADNWPAASGKLWWPEDTAFTAPPHTSPPAPPAGILRIQPNRSFEDPAAFGGSTSLGQGSMSLVFGVQSRAGMIEAQDTTEAAIRAIGDPSENDDAEHIWTLPGIEVNPGVQPRGIPADIAKAFAWIQFVIAYQLAEGFI